MKNFIRWSFLFLLLVTTGCSSALPNGRRWGEDAVLKPGWQSVGNSAWNALASPAVWAPAVGALVMQIDNFDNRLADWAVEHHPLFEEEDRASRVSELFQRASFLAYGTSVLATPSGEIDSEWGVSKVKGLGVGLAAYGLTEVSTEGLKALTNRDRPDRSDDRSFPSGHSSRSAVWSMLAIRNVENAQLPTWAEYGSKAGLMLLPYASGWARIEAAKHHPTDVLAGIALGNFFALFINDAFLGYPRQPMELKFESSRDGWLAEMAFRF